MLPWMRDPGHASDTLFFVAEEDWRLYEHDQLPQEQLFEASMQEAAVSLSQSPGHGGSISSQPNAADQNSSSIAKPCDLPGRDGPAQTQSRAALGGSRGQRSLRDMSS